MTCVISVIINGRKCKYIYFFIFTKRIQHDNASLFQARLMFDGEYASLDAINKTGAVQAPVAKMVRKYQWFSTRRAICISLWTHKRHSYLNLRCELPSNL